MRDGRLRLRVEQFAPALGEVGENVARVAAAQAEAAVDGVDLLVTPELAASVHTPGGARCPR